MTTRQIFSLFFVGGAIIEFTLHFDLYQTRQYCLKLKVVWLLGEADLLDLLAKSQQIMFFILCKFAHAYEAVALAVCLEKEQPFLIIILGGMRKVEVGKRVVVAEVYQQTRYHFYIIVPARPYRVQTIQALKFIIHVVVRHYQVLLEMHSTCLIDVGRQVRVIYQT